MYSHVVSCQLLLIFSVGRANRQSPRGGTYRICCVLGCPVSRPHDPSTEVLESNRFRVHVMRNYPDRVYIIAHAAVSRIASSQCVLSRLPPKAMTSLRSRGVRRFQATFLDLPHWAGPPSSPGGRRFARGSWVQSKSARSRCAFSRMPTMWVRREPEHTVSNDRWRAAVMAAASALTWQAGCPAKFLLCSLASRPSRREMATSSTCCQLGQAAAAASVEVG